MEDLDVKLDQISDRIFVTPSSNKPGASNAGIIVLENYIVVIDSYRFPSTAFEFRKAIENISHKNVKHLILTHCHGDHIFGSQAFRDCNIITHELERISVEKHIKTDWSPNALEKTRADLLVVQPDRAAAMEGLQVMSPTMTFDKSFSFWDDRLSVKAEHVGGHTSGSSIIYFPEEQILFSGDLIFSEMFPGGGTDPTSDPDQWIEGLRKILEMKVQKVVPGHGKVCDLTEVETYFHFLCGVKRKIEDLITAGKTENEVVNSEFPQFYEAWSPETRRGALTRWYRVWKQKETNPS